MKYRIEMKGPDCNVTFKDQSEDQYNAFRRNYNLTVEGKNGALAHTCTGEGLYPPFGETVFIPYHVLCTMVVTITAYEDQ